MLIHVNIIFQISHLGVSECEMSFLVVGKAEGALQDVTGIAYKRTKRQQASNNELCGLECLCSASISSPLS